MIRIGIYGYGNLGRGVECAIKQNKDMELVAVFTRRDPKTVKILTEGVSVYHVDDILNLKDKIDVQSTDTGLWIAELSQFGRVDLFKPRPEKPFEIDLLHGEFEWNNVEKLIAEQNKILSY